VDILSGLISYRSVPDLIPLLEEHNKLGFFFDMGEHIPYFNHLSPNIFYSSQQIWQTEYALGNWAHQEFGETGMMVTPLYESGYHIGNSFRQGTAAAGSTEIRLQIFPHTPGMGDYVDLDSFFTEVKTYNPSFIHAVFTGKKGYKFLEAWRQSGFHKTIPLTVVENMAYDDQLKHLAHLELELYAASTWNYSSEDARNTAFVRKFETEGRQQANIFGLLGYEAGQALLAVKPQLDKRDWDAAKALLQKESLQGPRGERNYYPLSGFSLPVIDIIKINTTAHKIYKTIVSQGKGLKFDSAGFREIHEGNVSGWQNPYFCI
jgi:branched-chain amino acid transport system substrate-binding protein